MQETMIPLPDRFRKHGFNFTLISRLGDVALLAKQKDPDSARSFEVVIIQRMGARTWSDGQTTEAHEHLPSNEEWGTYGWSFSTAEAAWDRFWELALKTDEQVVVIDDVWRQTRTLPPPPYEDSLLAFDFSARAFTL